VQRGGKWGFIDTLGREAIPPQFDAVRSTFAEGLIAVRRNGFWGYIGPAGQVLIDSLRYDEVAPFHNGYALVAVYDTAATLDDWEEGDDLVAKQWGCIDHSGRLAIPCRYTPESSFGERKEGYLYVRRKEYHCDDNKRCDWRHIYLYVDAKGNEYAEAESER
jgi:hypothetical protein